MKDTTMTKVSKKAIDCGRYIIHDTSFNVILTNDSAIGGYDGNIIFSWHKNGFVRVLVSANTSEARCIENLLHEVMELSMQSFCASYAPSWDTLGRASSSEYLFVMDHSKFSQVVAHAGNVLFYAIPRVRKAWHQLNRKSRKIKRRKKA